MNALAQALRREVRVAFSRRAQPVWFRIIKWTCILVGFVMFHDRRGFWWTLASLTAIVTAVHVLYRHKTGTWTRAWGGWTDLEAGRD